jgi:hypothetical protein
MENEKNVLYVQLNKALYVQATLLFWRKLTAKSQG